MRAADPDHLLGLYAATDDPWNFRAAPAEAARMDALAAALPRPRYRSALELGCGNGELARRLAPRCAAYAGLDAVPAALAAARRAVPGARFVQGFLPCDLPQGDHDLVVLSEILYFLDAASLRWLAGRLDRDHPRADLAVSTWLGPTGHALSGAEALAAFAAATPRARAVAWEGPGHRVDLFAPLDRAAP
jgi:trans-aconitate methyltransferase